MNDLTALGELEVEAQGLRVEYHPAFTGVRDLGDPGRFVICIAQPGEVTSVAPGRTVQLRAEAPTELLQLTLDAALLPQAARPMARAAMYSADQPVIQDTYLRCIGQVLALSFRLRRPLDPAFVRGLARDLAAHLAYAYGHSGPSRASTGLSAQRLATVLQRIDSGLAERLTVADLAATVNMSEFHFCRKFRRSTGHSPHVFLTLKRLDRARELLCGTVRPLAEVATSVGYTTHAHFSSVFHSHAGMPPGQYRRLHGAPMMQGALAE